MSLEDKIDALIKSQDAQTEALNKNTAALTALHAGREAALEKLTSAAPGAEAKPTRKTKATEAEPKSETTEKNTAAAPTTKAADTTKAASEPVPAISDTALTEAARNFLGASKDHAEKEDRSNFVRAIIAHFGTPGQKLFEVVTENEDRHKVLSAIAQYSQGVRKNMTSEWFDEENNPIADGEDML